MTYYYAGAPWTPSTNLPSNVMGDCPHKHKTPQAAQRCIDDLRRRLRSTPGMEHSYVDRVVMMADGANRPEAY